MMTTTGNFRLGIKRISLVVVPDEEKTVQKEGKVVRDGVHRLRLSTNVPIMLQCVEGFKKTEIGSITKDTTRLKRFLAPRAPLCLPRVLHEVTAITSRRVIPTFLIKSKTGLDW